MAKSIIQDYEEQPYCYVCGSNQFLHSHHCICGSGRRVMSEKYGLKLLLCMEHHTGKYGVHNGNYELARELQELAQRKFEETHTREEFRKEFGISFL